MSEETKKRKQFLFVDDDPAFLLGVQQLFSEMSRNAWEIFIAPNHAQALGMLSRFRVDVVVVDIAMPVMDGVQFLQLLGRTHPGQQVVILTGLATEENRKTCLASGAVMFLEKPVQAEGFAAVFAALDSLAESQPQSGFRGMMRRVGLQEVLQLECLGRKSSILEIFTGKVRGRIFICDGSIIHADSGSLQGEVALYGLLALRGGEFNLQPFVEPARRTIEGQWESLLMEAARLSDEGQQTMPADDSQPGGGFVANTTIARASLTEGIRIEEIVLCAGSGEVLHDWQVTSLELRVRLIEQIEQQAGYISTLASVGRFDRVEINTPEGRVVCQIKPDRRLFVRSAGSSGAAS